MSQMGFDAFTLGNHDFDNGMRRPSETTASYKIPIPFLIMMLAIQFYKHLLQYKIFNKSGIKIGVFGLGIELAGLVDPKLCKGITYIDPISIANKQANMLKNELNCDLIICLSHLGYSYKSKKVSDMILAQETSNIDLIIGGHTHRFLKALVLWRIK